MERLTRILAFILSLILLITSGCLSTPPNKSGIDYQSGDENKSPPPKINYGPDHVWIDKDGAPLPFDTLDDILGFLLTAEPIKSETIRTGVNRPEKVLLKKGDVEVYAIFRYQSMTEKPTRGGDRYFRDCCKGEIAAFEINRLLGLNNIPPTVYRTVNSRQGTLQLWAEGSISDRERMEKGIQPPDMLPVKKQDWDMDVFDNLINNIDRNQTNILIDSNWRLILIDHTRTFARDSSLPNPEKVERCSRGLWYALRNLDEDVVQNRLSPYLSKMEIGAIFRRQKRLIRHIQNLIDRKGEEKVLF